MTDPSPRPGRWAGGARQTWLERLTDHAVSWAHPATGTPSRAAELRIGDTERDAVAEAVRGAYAEGRLDDQECSDRLDAVLAARTLGELSVVTEDLPERGLPPAAADRGRPVAAVLGKRVHRGAFVLPALLPVTVAAGTLVVDLGEALVQHRENVIDARVLAGTLRILVPDGVEVVLSESILRGKHRVVRRPATGPHAPVIRVEGTITVGKLEIKRSRRALRLRPALDSRRARSQRSLQPPTSPIVGFPREAPRRKQQ